jgi:AAA domain
MQAKDLRPAGSFAQQYGVKMIAYGPPGAGKTPLINTAPRPILLIVEPGMLSMKGSTVPSWDAANVYVRIKRSCKF